MVSSQKNGEPINNFRSIPVSKMSSKLATNFTESIGTGRVLLSNWKSRMDSRDEQMSEINGL